MISLLFPTFGLLLASGAILSSISTHLFLLQLGWFAACCAVFIFFWFVPWRSIFSYPWFSVLMYGIGVLLLIYVYTLGPVVRNVKGWIFIGPFTFQPVELMKVAFIFLFAHYFSRRHYGVARLRYIIGSFLIFAIPAGLAACQPDMGSFIIFFGIWYGLLLLSGLPFKRIVLTSVVFVIAALVGWFYILKPYHRERIAGFLYPDKNTLGINYSVNQARIAIGSAGWWGKGYGQGTQTQLKYLPESSTDFVLAAWTEEWGWIGFLFVVGCFVLLEIAIIRTGMYAAHNFEKFICLGTVVLFALQFLINAGSTTGMLPVIGVTFPFLSYGGSSLLMNTFLLSIITSIRREER